MARRACGASPETCEAGRQRSPADVCAGAAWRALSSRPTALRYLGRRCPGKDGDTGHVSIGAGLWRGARSRLRERLRLDFPGDETMRISHEAIYQALYIQGRGALRRELTACLRTGRALRVPRARSAGRGKSFITPEVLISERPAEAEDRAVPGHWEGDLILGLRSSAIGTLVERTTRLHDAAASAADAGARHAAA